MSHIQVFDPALCCSTGVCGTDVDQAMAGRYPQRAELAGWAGLTMARTIPIATSGCSGSDCC